jgi:hypothetical protein
LSVELSRHDGRTLREAVTAGDVACDNPASAVMMGLCKAAACSIRTDIP